MSGWRVTLARNYNVVVYEREMTGIQLHQLHLLELYSVGWFLAPSGGKIQVEKERK